MTDPVTYALNGVAIIAAAGLGICLIFLVLLGLIERAKAAREAALHRADAPRINS